MTGRRQSCGNAWLVWLSGGSVLWSRTTGFGLAGLGAAGVLACVHVSRKVSDLFIECQVSPRALKGDFLKADQTALTFAAPSPTTSSRWPRGPAGCRERLARPVPSGTRRLARVGAAAEKKHPVNAPRPRGLGRQRIPSPQPGPGPGCILRMHTFFSFAGICENTSRCPRVFTASPLEGPASQSPVPSWASKEEPKALGSPRGRGRGLWPSAL